MQAKKTTQLISSFLLLFWFSGFTQTAFNPNVLPLGDTESLMGNSGTGGIGSTGSVYYNPGALTMVEGSSLSLSGSAYLSFKFTAKPLANIAGTDLDFEASGFQTVPTSVILVEKRKDWYFGFSALVPMEFSYEGRQIWSVPINSSSLNIKVNQNYSESVFLIGLSAARKIGDSWSAGVTFYGQNYSYTSILDFRGELSNDPSLIFQSSHREQYSPISLLTILGIQKTFDKVNLGLRVALPDFHISGSADYYNFEYTNFAGPDSIETSQIDITTDDAQFATPLDIRFGSSFYPNDKWLLTLDVAYRFGLEYNVFNDPRIDEVITTKGNFRANAGMEFKAWEKLAFYLGGAYIPTTLEETEGQVGQDFWSFFAGLKTISKYFETSYGFYYSQGKGEGPLSVGAGTTTETYTYFGFILGTNYRF